MAGFLVHHPNGKMHSYVPQGCNLKCIIVNFTSNFIQIWPCTETYISIKNGDMEKYNFYLDGIQAKIFFLLGAGNSV